MCKLFLSKHLSKEKINDHLLEVGGFIVRSPRRSLLITQSKSCIEIDYYLFDLV